MPEGIPVKTLETEFIRAPIVELSRASGHLIHSWTPIRVVGSVWWSQIKLALTSSESLAGLGEDGENMNLK